MYKIFFENRALIFQNIDENFIFSSDAKSHVDSEKQKKCDGVIVNWLNSRDMDSVVDEVYDAETFSNALKSIFRLAPAAGGVVCHDRSFVAIMRNGVLDLPKGHIEKGESPSVAALREVEEETGIKAVMLNQELPSTWHCYRLNNEWVLKQTFWYLMKPSEGIVFAPQHEEGISEVVLVEKKGVDDFLEKTYRSISEILGSHLRNIAAK